MRNVVVVAPVRTAIGTFGGALAGTPAAELGARVVAETLKRAKVAPEDANEVVMGHVLQAGAGANTARQAALLAGLPESCPAFTVNKVCASSMKAVALGALSVAAGESEVVVCGGMENMSAAPFLLPKARWGYRLGDAEALDAVLRDALTDPLHKAHMGVTAENLAKEHGVSRAEQDAFAVRSQAKAAAAMESGAFGDEIVPLTLTDRKGKETVFDRDEHPRPGTSAETLAKLKPAFQKDGTVTAGNASGINDGAAAMTLMSEEEAKRRGVEPAGRILAWASAGVDPMRMGIGPVPATRAALAKAGLALGDIELVELNEAFAAQSLAVIRELGLDEERVNVHGGAIALGHPVGASGARILVTLLHAMRQRGARRGLATLCVGGGQGMAVVVENEDLGFRF